MFDVFGSVARSWMGKVVLAVIVVTFVISFGYGSFTRNKEVLATVGRHEILVPAFNQQYQKRLDALRQRYPGQADALAQQLGLRKQVLDGMIDRTLLMGAARSAGFEVSDDTLRRAIQGLPAFQQNGQFDFGVYNALLRQNGMSPDSYEAGMRDDLLVQMYQQQVTTGAVVGQIEIEQRYRIESEAAEVEYVYVDPAKFRDAAKPDSTADQAYYDKNKGQFLQPEQFRVRYVVLGLGQMKEEEEIRPRAEERYYERNLETEFSTPRRVRASHILRKLDANAKPEEVARQREVIEKALTEARGGANFAALAKKYSQDPSARSGGDLGFFKREEMVPEFSEVAFSLKVGQVSGVIRTPFGFHIIKVTRDEPAKRLTFEQARPRIEQKLKQERVEHLLELEADRLPGRIEKEGLDAIARQYGVKPAETGWVDGRKPEAGLGQTAELYQKLRGRKPKEVGVVRRNPVQGHIFFQVVEEKPAYVKPLQEVVSTVRAKIAEEQRQAAAVAEAKRELQRMKSAADFSTYARSRGFKIENAKVTVTERTIPGVGADREFQLAAFRLTAQAPFGLSMQEDKTYLLHFKRRTLLDPDKAEERKKRIAQELLQDRQNYFLDAEIKRLRRDMKVKILIPEVITGTATAGT